MRTSSGARIAAAKIGPLVALAVILVGLRAPQAQAYDGRSAALDDIGRGTAAFRSGDIVAATQHWSEAIRVCRQIGAPDIEAQALSRRGEAYRLDADRDLRAALAKAEESGDQAMIAASSGALGNLAIMSRRTTVAEPLLKRSRDLASRLRDHKTLAAADNDLGNLYAATGRPVEAASAYREAIRNAEAAPDETLAATAEINAARLASGRGDAARAASLLSHAVDRLERSPRSYSRGMALISAGSVVFERTGSISPDAQQIAYHAFQLTAQTADAIHNPTLSSLALGSLGRLYERAPADATRQRGYRTGLVRSATSVVTRSRISLGVAARSSRPYGGPQRCRNSKLQARRPATAINPPGYTGGIPGGPLFLSRNLRTALSRIHRPVAAPRCGGSEERGVTDQARDTVEQLKETELQDYFRDSCVTDFEAKQRSIETITPGTAILYPISLPDRLEMLVSFGQQQQQFTIGVSEASLREKVRRFRELLEKRMTNEYLVPARQLYDQIIRPIEPALAAHRIDTLVVVPDEVLRIVPFAAFHDGSGFLVDRYAAAIAPSLKLVEPKPLTSGPGTALVLGISQSVQGYVDLPNVQQEVGAVHAIEGGDVLLNDAFTRSRFAADLKSARYNVVHIASHGQFGADPSQTFVLAFDGPLTMDDLEADIKYGPAHESPLELLILSACETASGDDRAALGLAGIALKAGARSALATLWYINDVASGELVTDFYKALQSGRLSRVQSLRAAQRALAADSRFAHPAYWAPFLLIGDWL
jgi:CHAT domain-containing protein